MTHEGVGFELIEVDDGHRCHLYTVKFDDSDQTELEKWWTNDLITSHEEFPGVSSALANLPDEDLPHQYKFKQKGYRRSGWVTPFVAKGLAELRLYCIKQKDCKWVIAGNGCIKDDDGPLQNFDRCRRTFGDIEYVDERIDRRLRGQDYLRELIAYDDRLVGDFYFEPEP